MKKIANSEVVVIVPTLNEAEGIGPTLSELKSVLGDPWFLVMDGKSKDGTVEIARSMGADVYVQSGKGKGEAVSEALELLDSSVRYVIFIDADHTYPAEYIPNMIEILEGNPDVGMVIGNRFSDELDLKKLVRDILYLGNRFLAFAQHLLNGVKLWDPLSGLRVVRWDAVKGWKPKSKSFDVEVEMNYYVESNGYHIVEVPIRYRRRLGEKKLKLRDGFTILRRILAESFSSFLS